MAGAHDVGLRMNGRLAPCGLPNSVNVIFDVYTGTERPATVADAGSSGTTESRPPSAGRTLISVGTNSGSAPGVAGWSTAPRRAGSAPCG